MLPERWESNKMRPTATWLPLGGDFYTVVQEGESQAEHSGLAELRKRRSGTLRNVDIAGHSVTKKVLCRNRAR